MSKADIIAQIIPLYVAYLEQKESALVRQVQQLKRGSLPQGRGSDSKEVEPPVEQPVAEEQPTSDQTGAAPAVTEPSTLFEG